MRLACSLIVVGAVVAGHAVFPAAATAQGVRRSLTADGGLWVAASGQLRLRGEAWTNFAAENDDDEFALSRAILRGEIHVRDQLAVVAEIRSSLASRRTLPGGVRPADEDKIDVQQLYAELASEGGRRGRAMASAGRFDLLFGRERLVGPLDWTNTRRAFQGARFRTATPRGEATFFWARPVTIRRRQPNIADSTKQLFGAYFSRVAGSPGGRGARAELYWLRSEARTASVNGTTGPDRRHTIGLRLVRAPAPARLDVELEGAFQTGTVGAFDQTGWMATAVLGRTFGGTRFYVGVDAASGDDTTGSDVQTFSQLYPTGHLHLGYMDMHGRQNVLAVSAGASQRLFRATTIALDVFQFRRVSAGDALYAADGVPIRAAGSGLPLSVGREIDLTVRHTMAGGRIILQAGASHYFAGPFFDLIGQGRDVGWSFGQLTATF